ncbi:DUF2125 domain-containing protein [Lentibacter algarum]|uniref:DUF2125 domain-containing protein n=1 Tax=Lentibacter algarum TaxID=576131 RepID=UPI001C09EB31|nr:DUF2125 domain-containing protein [Lentibacter algarum]MBU2982992.1 DUF2125 domain-containing protein [Lentibacter algarum]
MKKLLVVILTLSALWFGYWFVGSSAVKTGFEAWFEDRRAEGWQAEYSGLSLRGFPNRFDTTLTEPALADPHTGFAWQAPFLQIFALSYKPNHIIAAFADSQTISTPHQRYSIESTGMRTSMVMQPNTDLAFDRANLVSEAFSVMPDGGKASHVDGLQAALKLVEGADYRLALNIDGLKPALPAEITGNLPAALSALRADATLGFSKPWDISALEDGRPQPRTIKLHLAEAKWGELELEAAGTLEVDRAGTPTGTITIKARNWREIIALASAMEVAPQALLNQIEQGLSLLAQLNGNASTLDIPLGFSGGLIKLGPLPLGPAPRVFIQ